MKVLILSGPDPSLYANTPNVPNPITDITPLQNMIALEELYLNHNDITDISPLENLRKLNTLYLNHNSITDVQPLRRLNDLTTLYLNYNEIESLDPIFPIIVRNMGMRALMISRK